MSNDSNRGTATVNLDGSFSYTSDAGFNGRDSFTYKTSDGWNESNVATVRISDSNVNQEPVAGNDGYQTEKDAQLLQPAPASLPTTWMAIATPMAMR